MRLSARSNSYVFDWLSVYSGQPDCNYQSKEPVANNPEPQPVIFSEPVSLSNGDIKPASIITGTTFVYRMTAITMTVQLTATSDAGSITEMLIWTDSVPNSNWQPFSPFVWLPVSDLVFARFRDEFGNESGIVSDTIYPIYSPPTLTIYENLLPLILNSS